MGYIASDIKIRNRRDVYQVFQTHEEVSRVDLARLTAISNPTILKIVSYFLEMGLIEETVKTPSAVGRRPQMLRLVPEAFCSLGINYEGDYLLLGKVDLLGNVSAPVQIRTQGDYRAVIQEQLPSLIESYIQNHQLCRNRILGVGVGIPAIVDPEKEVLMEAPAIGIHAKVSVAEDIRTLSEQIGFPIIFENDANAAAIGEHFSRRFRHVRDLAFVSLGTGLGAGLILDNRLRRGSSHCCGEIGYMTHSSEFVSSTDHPGWMESRLSLSALENRYPLFKQLLGGVCRETVSGSPELAAAVHEVAATLAMCITNMGCLLDLEEIVLGGITARLLGPSLIEEINAFLKTISARPLKCSSPMCADSTVAGCAMLLTDRELQKLFEN